MTKCGICLKTHALIEPKWLKLALLKYHLPLKTNENVAGRVSVKGGKKYYKWIRLLADLYLYLQN